MIRRLSLLKRIISPISLQQKVFASTVDSSTMSKSYEVGSASDLSDGQKKEVELEDGLKILLAKVNGKFLATSSNCTHYGAPLVKGVLTSEGRITCPWHGACFDMHTGDIEDAPAIDAIFSFKTSVKDGKVYIDASESDLKAGRRSPTCAAKKAQESTAGVVIIGGGAAATTCSEGLREYGYTGKITVLSSEPHYPIDRTKLSKALITDPAKVALRDGKFYSGLDIDFKTSETVTSVDKSAKSVKLESGKTIEYSKLVIATGGTPNRLPMDGFDLSNVFLLRSIEHAQNIVSARDASSESRKNIIIVGSSFIGLEAAFANAEKHNVTVIGMEKVPLERVLGSEIGKQLQTSAESKGVKFYMDAGVEKALPSKTDPKVAGEVLLKDGAKLPCDLIVLGVGVKPATKFLDGTLELEEDSGIAVDEYLQVKANDDIYAAGDIAHFPYTGPGAEGKPIRIEHWDVAQNHGRTIAKNIAGKKTAFSNVPYFWSAQGGQIRYAGNNSPTVGWDDLVIQGSLSESKFAGFYCKGETVVAVVSMGYDPAVSQSSELMRRSMMPSKSEIKAGKDVREIAV